MKIDVYRNEPIPPVDRVVIEINYDEAVNLLTLFGRLNIEKVLSVIGYVADYEEAAQIHRLTSTIYYKLTEDGDGVF